MTTSSRSPRPPCRWEIRPGVPQEYLDAVGQSRLLAQLLYNRDVMADAVAAYLDPTQFQPGDPFLIPDVDKAVERINKALLRREKIGIFGDFDVDGVTSTAVIKETLALLGTDALVYIPDRSEGHGLSADGVRYLRDQGASLVITCDCGVTDLAEAEKSAALGVDLVISDHHVPLSKLPRAVAVVNPKRTDSRYPFREFAGCGVAYKLMQGLLWGDSRMAQLELLLELVALGSVADMVSLHGENRLFVQKGLRTLNDTHRPGVRALIDVSRLTPGAITSGDISWALGPRINSAGRLDHATSSLELLMTTSEDEALELARELDVTNQRRQALTIETYERAKTRIAGQLDRPLLMDTDAEYPEGVIGLVAGRLSKEYYRPTVIVTHAEDHCRGSTRSIPEFDMAVALERCSDLLLGFGGHPLAAGFSVRCEDVPELEQRLVTLAEERLADVELSPAITIDAATSFKEVGRESYRAMRALEPFGQGNPEPCFITRRVRVLEKRCFRNHEQWNSLKLQHGDVVLDAVDFRTACPVDDIPKTIDVVYTLRIRRFNGNEELQANVVDFRKSE
ncbi:MAG: single-stranded-DNA-specific exonuclease RecJ [Chloroflexota bacterium]